MGPKYFGHIPRHVGRKLGCKWSSRDSNLALMGYWQCRRWLNLPMESSLFHLIYENCFLNSLGMLSFYCIAFTCVMPHFLFHELSWGPFRSALFPPPHEDSVKENRGLRWYFLRVVAQLLLSYLLPAGQPALCHVSLQELCWS